MICEGRGLLSVMGVSGIDGRRTISNDITEVFAVLGIEAARNSIQNEIGSSKNSKVNRACNEK